MSWSDDAPSTTKMHRGRRHDDRPRIEHERAARDREAARHDAEPLERERHDERERSGRRRPSSATRTIGAMITIGSEPNSRIGSDAAAVRGTMPTVASIEACAAHRIDERDVAR